jgi:hypothetical protein
MSFSKWSTTTHSTRTGRARSVPRESTNGTIPDGAAVVPYLIDGEFEREADRLIDTLLSKGYLSESDGIRVTDS